MYPGRSGLFAPKLSSRITVQLEAKAIGVSFVATSAKILSSQSSVAALFDFAVWDLLDRMCASEAAPKRFSTSSLRFRGKLVSNLIFSAGLSLLHIGSLEGT
jgi:hypothetical protein